MVGEQKNGQAGASASIRVIRGGVTEAEMLFEQLSAGGTPVASGYRGVGVTLPQDGFVGLRSVSTASAIRGNPVATIDVNIHGITIREIRFLP